LEAKKKQIPGLLATTNGIRLALKLAAARRIPVSFCGFERLLTSEHLRRAPATARAPEPAEARFVPPAVESNQKIDIKARR